MAPKISICVPNLNTRPFLPERFRTIREQTFQDWELLIYDSYSEDGAWQYIQEFVGGEPRARCWQGPREGTPGSWSACIREARGEYVYIATSDDTMAPDCLEKLAAALDAHPECGLAHCQLRPIDEKGNVRDDLTAWWTGHSVFASSSGPLRDAVHIRTAPYDGLLHLLGESPYISITELLIRRSLFDRVGLFSSAWGSVGDFNWNMRAGLIANTIHVPDTWGGWRCHPGQATAAAALQSDGHFSKIDGMIDHAIDAVRQHLRPEVRAGLQQKWVAEARALRRFERDVAPKRPPAREAFVLWHAVTGSTPARIHATSSLRHRPFTDLIARWLSTAGVDRALIPVHGATAMAVA